MTNASPISLAAHRPTPPRALAPSAEERDHETMFDLAPVSLWLEDYGELRALFAEWRQLGVADLRAWLRQDAARVAACSRCIRIVKVNRRTLALYEAADLPQLAANLGRILRDDMLASHIEELAQLWDGEFSFFSSTVNYTLGGRRLDIQLHGRILPGHEETWRRVLVAIEDVTEREQARRNLARSELLRARPVRAFAGLAVGGGFQRGQAPARRGARARHHRFPHLHRRAPGVRRSAACRRSACST